MHDLVVAVLSPQRPNADVAPVVEHLLAKERVESSNLHPLFLFFPVSPCSHISPLPGSISLLFPQVLIVMSSPDPRPYPPRHFSGLVWTSAFIRLYFLPFVFFFTLVGLQGFEAHYPWLVFCLLLYPLLGWLFGIYTVLRWRQLPFLVLLQRFLITASFSIASVSIARWIINPVEQVWFLQTSVQVVWHSLFVIWSLLTRLALRRGLFLPDVPVSFCLPVMKSSQ